MKIEYLWVIKGFKLRMYYSDLEMVDRTLYNSENFVKIEPFIRSSLYSEKFAEVHIFMSICVLFLFGSTTWSYTVAEILPFTIWSLEQPHFLRLVHLFYDSA